jgi:hypothetical protein
VEKFNNRALRAELFQEWFAAGEQLEAVALAHERKLSQKREKAATLRPMLRDDILRKYHGDVQHTELVIQDCVIKGRWAPDPVNPSDESKHRFWVLDDESLTFSESLEHNSSMHSHIELDPASAQALASDAFSFGSSVGLAGLSDRNAAAVSSQFFAGASGAVDIVHAVPKAKAKAKAKAFAKAALALPQAAAPADQSALDVEGVCGKSRYGCARRGLCNHCLYNAAFWFAFEPHV